MLIFTNPASLLLGIPTTSDCNTLLCYSNAKQKHLGVVAEVGLYYYNNNNSSTIIQ